MDSVWERRQLPDREARVVNVVAGGLEDVPARVQFCGVCIVLVKRLEYGLVASE